MAVVARSARDRVLGTLTGYVPSASGSIESHPLRITDRQLGEILGDVEDRPGTADGVAGRESEPHCFPHHRRIRLRERAKAAKVPCWRFGLCETLPTSSGVAQGCRLAW